MAAKHRDLPFELTVPGMPSNSANHGLDVDQTRLDGPWLVTRMLTYPLFSNATKTGIKPELLDYADQLVCDERLRTVVTLACHVLDRWWIGRPSIASRGQVTPDGDKLVVEQLKTSLSHVLDDGVTRRVDANTDAVCRMYFRCVALVDALVGIAKPGSSDQRDPDEPERSWEVEFGNYPWLVLLIVVFRLAEGRREPELTPRRIDTTGDTIRLPLAREFKSGPTSSLWRHLPSSLGLTQATLIDGLQRLLAMVSLGEGTQHVVELSLEKRSGWWVLVLCKRRATAGKTLGRRPTILTSQAAK